MNSKLTKIVAICSFILSGTALFSCSGGIDGPQDDKIEGTLKIWWPGGSPTVENVIKDAKAKYESMHEGVNISIAFQSTPDFYLSYNMALMGKEFPDVAYIDHVYVQRLAYDNAIQNLSTYKLNETKDLFLDTVYKPNLYKNDLYAMPMSANVLTRVYNKGLLKKVLNKDITNEDLPTNWTEYIALGDKIKAYNQENKLTGNDTLYLTTAPAGTGAESMGAMYYLGMTTREGGTIINEDLTKMTLTSDANFEAAKKIKQLGDGGYTPKVFSESKFETGKVAFIEMGPWKLLDYSRMNNGKDIDFDYATIMPNKDKGDNQSTLGLYSLVMTKKSKKHALAADFMKFLTTNKEVQLAHNSVQYLMPTTKEALNDDFYKTSEWKVFVEQLNNAVARPGSAAWPAIEKQTAEFVTGLINGERDTQYLYSLQAALDEKLSDLDE